MKRDLKTFAPAVEVFSESARVDLSGHTRRLLYHVRFDSLSHGVESVPVANFHARLIASERDAATGEELAVVAGHTDSAPFLVKFPARWIIGSGSQQQRAIAKLHEVLPLDASIALGKRAMWFRALLLLSAEGERIPMATTGSTP